MIDKIKRDLLNILINKYEKSAAFCRNESPKRKISIRLYDSGKSDYPLYDIEQSDKRIEINQAVLDLCEREMLFFSWMKGEEDHIIAKVWLNFNNIYDAYIYLNRKPKSDEIDEICTHILEAIECTDAEWAKAFLQDTYNYIYAKRKIGNTLPTSTEEREGLLKCICFAGNIKNEELLERIFSLRCFGDSKRFEHTYRSRMLSVLRKYLDVEQNTKDEDLLRQIGIAKYPEQFEFCGSLILKTEHNELDLSDLRYGGSIFHDEIEQNKVILTKNVECVITIENKANYIDYIYKQKNENTLVIFHGGQYSQSKKKFFEMISQSISQKCIWLHWGDIDYGGFTMLARLRREINGNIQPYRMGIAELKEHQQYCASFNDDYAERLKQLLSYNELSDCYMCIKYMIANRKKLEQEALI
ncbi:MAG: DUF2220 family protein [Clostridia bacterium]|nr:DUF2220 family protein [Clostridia bacterium]